MGRISSILALGSRTRRLCDVRVFILWLFLQVGFIFSLVDQRVLSYSIESEWPMPPCILNLHFLERNSLDYRNLHFQNHEKGFDSDRVVCTVPQPSTIAKGQSPCNNMKDRGRGSIIFSHLNYYLLGWTSEVPRTP